ncbi:MAG: ribonuclease J [Chloroflexi bacterium]|nr:ribonuclease J [Chloroflexota bacterium]
MAKDRLKVIPLGGLGEIGKNMLALELGGDIIAIDCGLMFPKEGMLGVDLVIPDISYLQERKDRLRGIIITHGHEDHTGALPYVLPKLDVPVYATTLTRGLIQAKLKEHGVKARLEVVRPGGEVRLGAFRVGFYQVSHSIPDGVGLIIHTPLGTIVHSGDFKLDHTPVDGRLTDLSRLAKAGTDGVLLLFSDSTYVELPGYTPSEKVVGETLDRIMAEAPGRVIITTFASLVSRTQQVLRSAARHGRKVFVLGRSMQDTVKIATKLKYLEIPPGTLGQLEELPGLPLPKVVLLITGSQGEPTSALVRIARGDHPRVRILAGDTVVISASPIPGNEALINRTIDALFRLGAQVLYDKLARVHVHGHGSQEELKLLINLVHPKYFVPIHGEYRHLSLHASLAQSLGMPKENTVVLEDGDTLEIGPRGGLVMEHLPISSIYVDGLGGVGPVVLRDRQSLAHDGVVMVILTRERRSGRLVGRPDVVSRGFVEEKEWQALAERSRDLLTRQLGHGKIEGLVQDRVKDVLGRFFYQETHRQPMVLPVVVEV